MTKNSFESYISAAVFGLTLNLMLHFILEDKFLLTIGTFIGYMIIVFFSYFLCVEKVKFFCNFCDFCETIANYSEKLINNIK